MSDVNDAIRKRAYEIWEEEGRPHGLHQRHWDRAEREVAGKPAKGRRKAPAGTGKPAAGGTGEAIVESTAKAAASKAPRAPRKAAAKPAEPAPAAPKRTRPKKA